jgi:UDP-N-acetylglucosamine transferase subunit ALG13
MILVTIGTSVPFDRLLHAVGRIETAERIVVQRGNSMWCAAGVECVDFWPYDVLVDYVQRARIVVTHAGVGSILVCLQNGKRPIVAPRLRRFGEAVDDHQLELARRLHEAGVVTLVDDLQLLPRVVADDSEVLSVALEQHRALASELRDYLTQRVRGSAVERVA